jgi:two-component system cell cycle sensor histidine kinase/response regulator CckA
MQGNYTVLVVDDEETDRTAIIDGLSREGFDVLAAENYEQAIDFCNSDPRISFLVADVALPDGNGCALAIAARQKLPDLRVLFVSGHVGGEACRYYGLDVTDSHFLRKPFTSAQLVDRVKEVMSADDAFPDLYVPKTWSAT